MTDRSIRLWSWVGAHRLLAGWAAAVLCLAAFSGGIALGAAREQPAPFQQRARPALARPDSGLVTALVIGRRGASLITRTREGDLLIVPPTSAPSIGAGTPMRTRASCDVARGCWCSAVPPSQAS